MLIESVDTWFLFMTIIAAAFLIKKSIDRQTQLLERIFYGDELDDESFGMLSTMEEVVQRQRLIHQKIDP